MIPKSEEDEEQNQLVTPLLQILITTESSIFFPH